MSGNMTFDQCKDKALLEAKKDALRKAGVPEDVYSISIINLGNNEQFTNISTELGRISIDGSMILKDAPQYQTVTDPSNNLITCKATIIAEVIVTDNEDKEFIVNIKGIKESVYHVGEPLSFSIMPYQNCYLRIFCFDANNLKSEGIQFFPYDNLYMDNPFMANQWVVFPPNKPPFLQGEPQEYPLNISNDGTMENDLILIVALKKKIPYTGKMNYENVMRWLSSISKGERYEIGIGITIIK